jgi:hypothetical protein
MPYAIKPEGVWIKDATPIRIGEVVYLGGLAGMSPEQRAEAGAVWYEPSGPAPTGQTVVGTYLTDQGGAPVEKNILQPIPLDQRKAELLALIDAERDRRQQIDFAYDFAETAAIDDAGQETVAGVKALQMRKVAPNDDQQNWDVLQGQALAAVITGQGGAVLPMRAEDNWNVQTTAEQVLAASAAMVQRNAAILFFGGALKSQVRSAANGAALDAINISIGWPG